MWSRFFRLSFLFIPIFQLNTALAGPIYVYEQDGVTKFSSKPPPKGITAKVFTAKKATFSSYRVEKWQDSRLFLSEYAAPVKRFSKAYGVEEALIRSLIQVESGFNPKAVSKRGALGLMQLMPQNVKLLGVANPFAPEDNIQGGVALLAMLVEKYEGDLSLVLAAYNAGEGAVEKFGGIPPYDETQDYVRRIKALLTRYRVALND